MSTPPSIPSLATGSPHAAISPPSPWVARFAPLVPKGGPVLDLACGSGRHLRLFHTRNPPVVGLDRDLRGVADLAGRAGGGRGAGAAAA